MREFLVVVFIVLVVAVFVGVTVIINVQPGLNGH